LPGLWTFYKLHPVWNGTFRSVIAGACWGARLSMEAWGTYVWCRILPIFIACSAALFYHAASRRLRFMTEHPLVAGLFFGAAVEEVMNLIVCPSPRFTPGALTNFMTDSRAAGHMVVVGLPISFSVRRFAK